MIRETDKKHRVGRGIRTTLSLWLLLPGLLLLSACGEDENAGDPEAGGVEMNEPRTEPADFRQTLDTDLPLDPAEGAISEDKPVLKTPDGKIAPYGVKSARIVFDIKGDRKGRMIQEFDNYGLVDRRHDSSVATKQNDPNGSLNELSIINPEISGTYDFNQKSGWAVPNTFHQDMENGPEGKKYKSSLEFFLEMSKAKKLGDTTINGYETQVYQVDGGPLVQTIWMWRNIPIRFHYFAPFDNLEWRYEPVSITLDPELPAKHFEFPKEYKVRMQAAPPTGGVSPPPPALVREDELPEGAKVEGEKK